jgi:hypothetical protein
MRKSMTKLCIEVVYRKRKGKISTSKEGEETLSQNKARNYDNFELQT